MKSNSNMHALVSRNRETSNKESDNKDTKLLMATDSGSLSSSIKNIGSVSTQREVNDWQSTKLDLDLKLLGYDPVMQGVHCELIKKRVRELDDQIASGKKTLKSEFGVEN